jgi:hypothetical protein
MVAFAICALLTPVSLGAYRYVEAAGTSKTLVACADRKTGVMRYLTKGKCKNSERRITWNQQGLQGNPGLQGAPGLQGERALETFISSANFVVDGNGAFVGHLLSVYSSDLIILALDGKIWRYDFHSGGTRAAITVSDFFSDSNCQQPLASTSQTSVFSDQLTYKYYDSEVLYKAVSILMKS